MIQAKQLDLQYQRKKVMLFSTSQLSKFWESRRFIDKSGKFLERAKKCQLPRLIFIENFKHNKYCNKPTQLHYSLLRTSRQFECITLYNIHTHHVETLVLCRLY